MPQLALRWPRPGQLVQPVTVTGTTSVSGRIYEHLRAEILAGAETLPSERRLAEDLGASRHAVREALKRLQQSGLIRISHGGATKVRDWRAARRARAAAGARRAARGAGIERAVMEMRASVGADAARRAATRATAVQRAELEARAEMLAAEHDLDVRNTLYEAFWDLIIDAADNLAYRLALNTLQAGRQVSVDARRVAAELNDPQAIRALAAAIASGRSRGGEGPGAGAAGEVRLDGRGPLLRDPVLRPPAGRRGGQLPPLPRGRPRRLRAQRHAHEHHDGARERDDQRRLEARRRRDLRRACTS